jgi:hypothetical protein
VLPWRCCFSVTCWSRATDTIGRHLRNFPHVEMNEGANDGRKDALLYKRVRLLRRRIHVINVVAGSVAHRARSPDLDEDLPTWHGSHHAPWDASFLAPSAMRQQYRRGRCAAPLHGASASPGPQRSTRAHMSKRGPTNTLWRIAPRAKLVLKNN